MKHLSIAKAQVSMKGHEKLLSLLHCKKPLAQLHSKKLLAQSHCKKSLTSSCCKNLLELMQHSGTVFDATLYRM